MAYVTEAYLESMIGASKLAGLLPDATAMSAAIAAGTALVEGALQSGGYTQCVPASVYAADASDCPESIRVMTCAAVQRHAYSRADLGDIPDDVYAAWTSIRDVREGLVELPGLPRSTVRSTGGISSTSSAAQPRIFRSGVR